MSGMILLTFIEEVDISNYRAVVELVVKERLCVIEKQDIVIEHRRISGFRFLSEFYIDEDNLDDMCL